MSSISFFFVLLALGTSVKLEEISVETGSGSGDVQTASRPNVYLIDDNGDIPTSPNNLTERPKNGSSSDIDYVLEDFTTDIKRGNESTTMIANTTETTVETTTSHPTIPYFHSDVPNQTTTTENPVDVTTVTTEADSTTLEATVAPTTSTTETPTSTSDETSTFILMQKTTTSPKHATSSTSTSTSTVSAKSDKSKDQMPSKKPSEDKNVCVFLSSNFECNKEVVCFGEGEIDCEPEDDQLILDKISVSSPSEDIGDYEESIIESETIGTFPPNLVGTQKKISMYNLPTVTPTVTPTSDEMEETSPTEQEEDTTITVTIVKGDLSDPRITISKEYETTVKSTTMKTTEDDDAVTKNQITTTEKTETTTIINSTSFTLTFESDADYVVESQPSKIFTSLFDSNTTKGEDDYEMIEATKSPTTEAEKVEKKMEKVRRKRGFFSLNADLTPEAKKKLAVEYLHGKYLVNPTCRLSGNIQCFPVPTLGTCRGKTFCQATQRKPETAESSKAKGWEVWLIVVIVICVLFGTTTVAAMTYLGVHSCKKLKVQPTHDVTPLNYITKKAETTEMA